MDIDEGRLSSLSQLPVKTLNYGASEGRLSWILYRLGYLECTGKASGAKYPSEVDDTDYFFKYGRRY